MARPPAKETKTLTIHLPSALYDWLHKRADELATTKTALVVKTLQLIYTSPDLDDWLNQHAKDVHISKIELVVKALEEAKAK